MVDFVKLNQAFEPSRALEAGSRLYVDWQKDLSPDDVKILLTNSIARAGSVPVTRLFTGHRGTGKTTELQRVKRMLEARGFFVSMLEAEEWIDLQDVTATDIVYNISKQLVYDLNTAGFSFGLASFQQFFKEVWDLLNAEVEIKDLKLKAGETEIGLALREVPVARGRLRMLLEQRLPKIYDLINQVIIQQARQWLSEKKGLRDLVVLVDQLDRIPWKHLPSGATNHEALFLDNAGPLRFLACHVLYVIPIELAFSHRREALKLAYGSEILSLPVIPVVHRDGTDNEEAIARLGEVVDLRAREAEVRRLDLFEDPALLTRLCHCSGGHLRSLMILIRSALDRCDQLPLTTQIVERTLAVHASGLAKPLSREEKDALNEVHRTRAAMDDTSAVWLRLLRDQFVLEYQDRDGSVWYDRNPLLGDLA